MNLVELASMPRIYRCIVADPAWMPDLGGTWSAKADKGRPQRFYPTMTLDDIKALQVPAASQCHLYLWCISQHVDWGYEVARAWGFDPVVLMTWKKPGLGVGRFRCNTEHFLIARKGNRQGNPFGTGGRVSQATDGTCFDWDDTGEGELLEWPRARHSEKPKEIFELAEKLSPGPRLEMFARTRRAGWDGWGNQYPDEGEAC